MYLAKFGVDKHTQSVALAFFSSSFVQVPQVHLPCALLLLAPYRARLPSSVRIEDFLELRIEHDSRARAGIGGGKRGGRGDVPGGDEAAAGAGGQGRPLVGDRLGHQPRNLRHPQRRPLVADRLLPPYLCPARNFDGRLGLASLGNFFLFLVAGATVLLGVFVLGALTRLVKRAFS
jgi:hypothetical protein